MNNKNTDEHILVCLSAAPSNQKIIDTAAKIGKNNIYCVTLGELKEELKLKGTNRTKKETVNATDKKEI